MRETTAKQVSVIKKKGEKPGKKQCTKVIVIIFLKQHKIHYVQVEGEGEGWEKNVKLRKYWEEYKERIWSELVRLKAATDFSGGHCKKINTDGKKYQSVNHSPSLV